MALFFNIDPKPAVNDDDKRLFQEAEPAGGGKDNDTSTTDYTDDKEANDGDDSGAQGNASGGDGGNDPANSPEDYTLNDDGTTGDSGEDQDQSEAENNPPEEGSEGGEDMGGGEDDMGMASDGDGSGGGGGGEGDEGGGDGAEGSGGDDFGDGDDDYDGGGGGENPDKIKELEDQLFADFNAAQRVIMSRSLKKKYHALFTMCDDVIDRINDIPKAMEHIQAIEFVSLKMTEIKDMLSDYLYYTYNTKSYIENEIQYKRYIALLNQLNRYISKIPSIKPDKG